MGNFVPKTPFLSGKTKQLSSLFFIPWVVFGQYFRDRNDENYKKGLHQTATMMRAHHLAKNITPGLPRSVRPSFLPDWDHTAPVELFRLCVI